LTSRRSYPATEIPEEPNSKNYHHFFPKVVLNRRGVEPRRINHIANITIVDDFLNKRKIKTRKPSDYMPEFRQHNPNLADTMTSHLIDLETGVWDDDYDAFFAARCKAISDELQNWIPLRPCDDAKPVVIGDDSDPDEVEEDSEFDAVADDA